MLQIFELDIPCDHRMAVGREIGFQVQQFSHRPGCIGTTELVQRRGPAQTARLDANDRVLGRIEVLVAGKNLARDLESLQLPGIARQRFLDRELQKVEHLVDGVKLFVLKNALQLLEDRLLRNADLC